MKKIVKKACKVVASAALTATKVTVNSTCVFYAHQAKLPANAKKLRKF